MQATSIAITLRGKTLTVPSIVIDGHTVISKGKWLKIASIRDEEWLEGDTVTDPERFISTLRNGPLNADAFTFSQKCHEATPKYPFYFEWENVAAIPIKSFEDWWEKRLPQESRKNVRRAERRGVVVREVAFDDALVRGIMGIYNADEVRQTGRFWHYGKSFEVVKKENATYQDRSCFIGAYSGEELIGFIKMVYVDKVSMLMQIVAKSKDRDKRPMNALLAKAVELCAAKGITHLIYGKYIYGNKGADALTEFKRRNGFEMISYPKYCVPLNVKGSIAVKLRLHRGLLGLLPSKVITSLVRTRLWLLQKVRHSSNLSAESVSAG